jgi:hypothetical protein
LRRERQLEGIAMAKREGAYKGSKARLDRERVKKLSTAGLGPAAIARELGMARSSVYRLLEETHRSASRCQHWDERSKHGRGQPAGRAERPLQVRKASQLHARAMARSPPPYSISSSARARSVGEEIAVDVLRLGTEVLHHVIHQLQHVVR